jgi:hypothetical protein
LLSRAEVSNSHLAGHVLNYFEFEAPKLSEHQKLKRLDFLNTHEDETHSQQVVAELHSGKYLASTNS